MALGSYKFTVKAENDGQQLRTFLRKEIGLTARSMTVLKDSDLGITRNGAELRARDILYVGDKVEIALPAEINDITPVPGELDILYEDDHLLVINKPADMPVHPTKVHQTDTLANILSFYQNERGESYTFRALNRLDKDTSGCVLIAKDRIAYSMVKPSVRKIYLAVCEGEISESGTVNAPIALDDGSKIRRCVSMSGLEAITHYIPVSYDGTHTLLALWLETGRTHQIRCHMSYIGHPLAGDDMYGGSLEHIKRQALHCAAMKLIHPVSGEELTFHSDVPEDMKALISADPDPFLLIDSLDPAERSQQQENYPSDQ